MRNTTLCYLERDGKVLMLFRNRKKNDVNKGKWIGIGGKFEEGESPEECAAREVREETGLTIENAKLRGIVTFVYDADPSEYMFLYTGGVSGEMIPEDACPEGELAWIEKEKISSLPTWEGDRIFLSLLSKNAPFFSLKLVYDRESRLTSAVLDGKELKAPCEV